MKKLIYRIGKLNKKEQLKLDFEDALSRTIEEHIESGFIPMELPMINNAPYRIFNTTAQYRKWANKNLPKWLGYYKGFRNK